MNTAWAEPPVFPRTFLEFRALLTEKHSAILWTTKKEKMQPIKLTGSLVITVFILFWLEELISS